MKKIPESLQAMKQGMANSDDSDTIRHCSVSCHLDSALFTRLQCPPHCQCYTKLPVNITLRISLVLPSLMHETARY